jgi:hypothetical protein
MEGHIVAPNDMERADVILLSVVGLRSRVERVQGG